MKIIEVRDGFIKYEADENTYPFGFVRVDGENKSYIAQVNQVKNIGDVYIGSAKILFIFNGSEYDLYDKTEPPKDALIYDYTEDVIKEFSEYSIPIVVGKTTDNKYVIPVDLDIFNKKTLICIDNKDNLNTITKNLSVQFNNAGKKTLVLDTIGNINAKKFKPGVDFKLPLDTSSLAFLYNECLTDATTDSKSVIMDIFKDLSEYSKTVPFVPLSTLKTIVDDMFTKEHVLKLFVLKNKLAKLEKTHYFADSEEEVTRLNKILNLKNAIIDLSSLNPAFQNRFLSFIYETLKKHSDIQVLFEVSNSVSKKNLKEIITQSPVATTFVSGSGFKYIGEIKGFFENYIIEANTRNTSVFSEYSGILKIASGNYITVGKATCKVPFASGFQIIEDVPIIEAGAGSNDISDEDIASEINEEQKEEIIDNIQEHSNNVIETISEEVKSADTLESLFDDSEENDEAVTSDETEIEGMAEENEEISEISSDSEGNTLTEPSEEVLEEVREEENKVTENEETIINVSDDSLILDEEETEQMALDDGGDEKIVIPEEIPETKNLTFDSFDEFNANSELTVPKNSEYEEPMPEIDTLSEEDAEPESTADFEENTGENSDMFDEYEQVADLSENQDLDNDELLDEIVELDPDDADENDIVIDMTDDERTAISEDTEQEIIADVDKVYTTIKNDDDEISDADLDLIDELSSEDNELEISSTEDDSLLEEISDEPENEILEEISEEKPVVQETYEPEILEKRDSSTPIVPVYDADIPQEDLVVSDPIQQGDAVIHTKYGTGVVEKMIKYGNKTLFSINFDNIGRRLLDPTLTEIKKA